MIEMIQDEIVVIMGVTLTMSVTMSVTTIGGRSPRVVGRQIVKWLEELLEARNPTRVNFRATEKVSSG